MIYILKCNFVVVILTVDQKKAHKKLRKMAIAVDTHKQGKVAKR